MPKNQPIEILLVEDNPEDAALIELELEKAGYLPEISRVETARALQNCLMEKSWDILISDYNLPGFDGLSALKIVQKAGLDIPFILVSGTVGEEFAVEAVLAGASDYVMKDNLKRLSVAVRREIHNGKLREQNRQAEIKIHESLKEKEVMLKEIHHRVKNNLAVISALLTLQSDYVEDGRSRQLFRDSVGRIKSMALIHEKLYQSDMLASVAMDEYLRELVQSIKQSYQTDNCDIAVHVTVDDIRMDITRAIPCGLIVNELLANSYKHAFNNRKAGNIYLTVQKMKNKYCFLEVRDDGTGIPEDVVSGERSSLGFTIVQGLAGQLSADMDMHQDKGTRISLEFKT